MARSKKQKKAPSRPTQKPRVDKARKAKAAPEVPSVRKRREIRPYVYVGFDLLMVGVWVTMITSVVPNRHAYANALLWSMTIMPAVMAGAMFLRNKHGWRAAAVACGALLVLWVVLIITLLMSAAFLSGVYGAFGKAAAMSTLVIALITVQLVAIVPAFQLKFLMTRAGRRYFRQEPFWP